MNFNSRNVYYKTPYGAVKRGEKISLRFPIASWVPVNRVLVYFRTGEEIYPVPMRFVGTENDHGIYEA